VSALAPELPRKKLAETGLNRFDHTFVMSKFPELDEDDEPVLELDDEDEDEELLLGTDELEDKELLLGTDELEDKELLFELDDEKLELVMLSDDGGPLELLLDDGGGGGGGADELLLLDDGGGGGGDTDELLLAPSSSKASIDRFAPDLLTSREPPDFFTTAVTGFFLSGFRLVAISHPHSFPFKFLKEDD
jgi:hypothetical protein